MIEQACAGRVLGIHDLQPSTSKPVLASMNQDISGHLPTWSLDHPYKSGDLEKNTVVHWMLVLPV